MAPTDEDRVERWQHVTAYPLTVLSVLFIAVYAGPILDPATEPMCGVCGRRRRRARGTLRYRLSDSVVVGEQRTGLSPDPLVWSCDIDLAVSPAFIGVAVDQYSRGSRSPSRARPGARTVLRGPVGFGQRPAHRV